MRERGEETLPGPLSSPLTFSALSRESEMLGTGHCTGQPGWQFSLIQIVIMVPATADTAPSPI